MFDIFAVDWSGWLNLALRWFHITAGIAWIGGSFYFIWLDYNLQAPKSEKKKYIFGELWSVHGGGFYHSKKFARAPRELPDFLHWFKWEAYTTWISGFLLFVLIYYLNAQVYLIDAEKFNLTPLEAIGVSMAFLVGTYLCYDLLCRFVQEKFPILFGIAVFLLITCLSYGLVQFFSNRAAFLHFGVVLGTIMAGNVFFVIIPNQKKIVKALLKNEKPNFLLGKRGKTRSVHNNYLTLPVLFTMISGHYPLTFGHPFNWILLVAITFFSAFLRHYFNLKHQGKKAFWVLVVSFFVMLIAIYIIEYTRAEVRNTDKKTDENVIKIEQVQDIFEKRCNVCHSDEPTFTGLSEPPSGVSFEKPAEIEKRAKIIYDQVVVSKVMPLGNITKMSEEERAVIAQWFQQREKK
jgi:uncharacterized membrane protein